MVLIEFFLSLRHNSSIVPRKVNSAMVESDYFFISPMHHSSTVARNKILFFAVQCRVPIELLLSSIHCNSYILSITFFCGRNGTVLRVGITWYLCLRRLKITKITIKEKYIHT